MAKQYLGTKLQDLGNFEVLDPTDRILVIKPYDEGIMALSEFLLYVKANLDFSNFLTAKQINDTFATKADTYTRTNADAKFAFVDKTYTKTQSDARFATRADTFTKDEATTLFAAAGNTYLKDEVYSKQEAVQAFALKSEIPVLPDLTPYSTTAKGDLRWALKTDVYTKTESDARYPLAINVYNKTDSDVRFAKAANTYTKAEVEAKFLDTTEAYTKSYIDQSIYLKSQVYTKLETDAKFQLKSETYTISDVDTQFAAKSWVYSRGEADLTFATKADTYTKTEVNTLTDSKVSALATNLNDNYYNKSVSDARYMVTGTSYSKSETDTKYPLKTQTVASMTLSAASLVYTKVDGTSTTLTVPTWNQSTTGNAATATVLQTARTINGVSFNGSANITTPAYNNVYALDNRTLKPNNLPLNTATIAFSSLGGMNTATANTAYVDVIGLNTYVDSSGGNINALAFSKSGGQALYHFIGNFGSTSWTTSKQIAYTDSSITGNAATATKLATPRTVAVTGAVTAAGVNFDGTANVSLNATSVDATKLTGIVPNASITGTYSDVTLNITNGLVYAIESSPAGSSSTAYGLGSVRAAGTTQNSVIVIKTSIPKTVSTVINLHLKGLSDSETNTIDITLSGYTTGNFNKLSLGTKDFTIQKAETSDGYHCFVVSHPSGYLGTSTAFSIVSAHLNYSVTEAYLKNWTIYETTDTSTISNMGQPIDTPTSVVRTQWTNIQGKPTTVAGFGITDSYVKADLYTKAQSDAKYALLTNVYNKTEIDSKISTIDQIINTVTLSPTALVFTRKNNATINLAIPTWNQSTTGNAATATKLATARSIALTGDGVWSVSFDGTANVTAGFALTASGVTGGTYSKVTVDTKGRVTAGMAMVPSDIPNIDMSKVTTGILPVTQGGTGATNGSAARDNLGIGTAATYNAGTAPYNIVPLNNLGELSLPSHLNVLTGNLSLGISNGRSVGGMWLSRSANLSENVIYDFQDEFAYLDKRKDCVLTTMPVVANSYDMFRNNESFVIFQDPNSTSIVIEADISNEFISVRSSSGYRLGITVRTNATIWDGSVTVETWDKVNSVYVVVYNDVLYKQTYGAFLSPIFYSIAGANLGFYKVRITLKNVAMTSSVGLGVQRVMLYHGTAQFNPWELSRLGGKMYGPITSRALTTGNAYEVTDSTDAVQAAIDYAGNLSAKTLKSTTAFTTTDAGLPNTVIKSDGTIVKSSQVLGNAALLNTGTNIGAAMKVGDFGVGNPNTFNFSNDWNNASLTTKFNTGVGDYSGAFGSFGNVSAVQYGAGMVRAYKDVFLQALVMGYTGTREFFRATSVKNTTTGLWDQTTYALLDTGNMSTYDANFKTVTLNTINSTTTATPPNVYTDATGKLLKSTYAFGTAATKNTGTNDGDVMTVGSFGIGTGKATYVDNTSINTLVSSTAGKTGVYRSNNSANTSFPWMPFLYMRTDDTHTLFGAQHQNEGVRVITWTDTTINTPVIRNLYSDKSTVIYNNTIDQPANVYISPEGTLKRATRVIYDASSLSGTVNNGNLNGTYNGFNLELSGNRTVYTNNSNGKTVFGLADYQLQGNATGYIVFKTTIPGTSNTMLQLYISGMAYGEGLFDTVIKNYQYGNNLYVRVARVSRGTIDIPVRYGVTPDGYICVIVGEKNKDWYFPHLSITHGLISNDSNVNYLKGWTSYNTNDLTGYSLVTVPFANDVSVVKVTWDNVANRATTRDGYGITDVYTKTETIANYYDKTTSDGRFLPINNSGRTTTINALDLFFTNSNSSPWVSWVNGATGYRDLAISPSNTLINFYSRNAGDTTVSLTFSFDKSKIWHSAYGNLHDYFAKAVDVYSKGATDARYAFASNVYSKTETDALYSPINLTKLYAPDTRSTGHVKPNTMPVKALSVAFADINASFGINNGYPWGDVIVLNTWGEPSGGSPNAIITSRGGSQGIWHARGTFNADSWTTVKQIAYTDSNITGNSATATKLQTARTIAVSGAVTGTATAFDGSGNITIPTTTVDATKLTGIIPNANLSGIYNGFDLELLPSNIIYTKPVAGTAYTAYGIISGVMNGTGAVVIETKIPSTVSSMIQVYIKALIHYTGKMLDSVVQWYGTHGRIKNSTGNADYSIRIAVNAGGMYCIVIGEIANTWDNAHFSVPLTLTSYSVSASHLKGWTMALVTDLSAYTSLSTEFSQIDVVNGPKWSLIKEKPTTVSGYGITDTYTKVEITSSVSAFSATKLTTARTINGISFDGTANITVADSTKLPLIGGTLTGKLTVPGILLNKSSNSAAAISWYSGTYNAWQDYIGAAGSTTNGYNGNITAPNGLLVNSWGRRSFIENAAGYGWTFESGASSATTPVIVAEIRSSDGSARFGGSVAAGTDITAGGSITASGSISATGAVTVGDKITVTRFNSATAYSFLNGSAAQQIMTGGILVSNSYTEASNVPTNGIYSKGDIKTAGNFIGTAVTQTDGTSNTQIATTAFVQNAVGGLLYKTGMTGGTLTLTGVDVSNASLEFAGTLTSNLIVVVPATNKRLWTIVNSTTGDFTLTVKTASGTGVTVSQGRRKLVYCDGTNVFDAFTDFENVTVSGVITASTAPVTTNNSQVATTEYVVSRIAYDAPTKTGTGATGVWNIAVTGNAASATKLATARTIGGVAFDGTANINLPGVNAAGNQSTTGNAATATKFATARTIGGVAFDGTANINLPGVNAAGNQDTSGNAATATKLATARTFAISGAATGTATAFDGTANISIPVTALDATKLTGIVPNNNLSGIYSGFTHVLDGTNSIYTTYSAGRTVYGLAEYRYSGALTGAIVFMTNVAVDINVMKSIRIRGYNYTVGVIDMLVDGYSFTNGAIVNNGGKISVGSIDFPVRFGATSDKKLAIILGEVNTVWQYPHMSITEALFSHTVSDNMCYGWTSKVVTQFTEFTTLSAPMYDVVSKIKTDWNNVASTPTTLSGYGITDTYTRAELDARYSLRTGGIKAITLSTTNLTYTNDNDSSTNVAVPTWNQSTTGNAATATVLQTARTINGVSFNGASDISTPAAGTVLATDKRTMLPNALPLRSLGVYFTSKGGLETTASDATYGDFLSLNTYTDSSGGGVNGLFFSKGSQAIYHYFSTYGSTNPFPAPKKLAYTDSNITGNAATATILQTARTIALSGPITGNANFDGSANITIATTLAASPAFTGTPTAPTPTDGTNTTQLATTAFVQNTVGGYLSKTGLTGGTVALTDVEASNATLYFAGALTSNLVITVPITNKRLWAVWNNTTGAFTLTIKTPSGAGVTVAQGKRNLVYNDGTTIQDAFNDFESIALTGVPTAPTATVGDSSTQIATTAFVNAEIANDAPTKTGGGASGTWAISISGNAATATTATSATNATNATNATTAITTTGNAGSATKLQTARIFTLSGVVTGSGLFDGTANPTITTALAANTALTGTPTTPTPVDGTNTTQIASTAFVQNTVGGYLSKSVTGGTVALTEAEASNATLYFAGTLTSNLIVTVPVTNKRLWAVWNNTSGAFTLTIKTPSGTGVLVAQGKRNLVYSDGTNVQDAFNDFESIALTGVPTAPTATVGDSSTQIATTAFVNAEIANDAPSKTGTGASGTWAISISGNAASATKLATARTIGGVAFDGTTNINLPGVNAAGNQDTTGNAGSATKLQTARTINGVSFDGTANITVADASKLPTAGGTVTGNLTVNGTTTAGVSNATNIGISTTSGTAGNGISLYGGAVTTVGVLPSYGFSFSAPGTFGTHGSVTATDWAVYLTCIGATNRGWIFKNTTSGTTGNVASISGTGNAQFNGSVYAGGDVTAFSDKRLKENITPITNALSKVKELNGVTYTRNDLEDKELGHIGLIAQDVQVVFPEAVRENNDGYLSLNYMGLVGSLVEAIKELDSKNQTLEARLAKLEEKLS